VQLHGLQPVRGYEVTAAASGAALYTVAEHRPDFIVLASGYPTCPASSRRVKAPPWSGAAVRR